VVLPGPLVSDCDHCHHPVSPHEWWHNLQSRIHFGGWQLHNVCCGQVQSGIRKYAMPQLSGQGDTSTENPILYILFCRQVRDGQWICIMFIINKFLFYSLCSIINLADMFPPGSRLFFILSIIYCSKLIVPSCFSSLSFMTTTPSHLLPHYYSISQL
jgi:hypothetical protein